MNDLGERLFKLRRDKKLSQEEVAEKLNVTRQTVSKWETNQSMPDFDKVVPLCELYGITPDELFIELKGKENTKNNECDIYLEEEEKIKISKIIGLAALKYADLSNQISKDYIFDIDKFTSFEGKTGPYILYTLVRIKSILNKFYENHEIKEIKILNPVEEIEEQILLKISKYNQILEESYIENVPSKICTYLYELANIFNSYYQKVKILKEDSERLESNISLLILLKKIFENGIELLGFEAPEKM